MLIICPLFYKATKTKFSLLSPHTRILFLYKLTSASFFFSFCVFRCYRPLCLFVSFFFYPFLSSSSKCTVPPNSYLLSLSYSMQNGHGYNRAQPHEGNLNSADAAARRVVTSNNAPRDQQPQLVISTPPAAAAALTAPAAHSRSTSSNTPVSHPLDANSREGGSVSNSPFFHSPKSTASVFHPEIRHSTLDHEEGSDVMITEGQPFSAEKRAAGEPAKPRQPFGTVKGAVDNADPYSDVALGSRNGGDAGDNNNNDNDNDDDNDNNNSADYASTRAAADTGNTRQHLLFSESFRNQAYVKELPVHLVPLAHEIHQLDEDDLAYISDVTHTMANRDLYSLLPYTGSNWFLPSIRECDDDEAHWELRYTWKEGLIIAIGGRRLSLRLLNVFIRVCFIVLIWFMLWNMLPRWLVQPGGYVWDPAVLVVVAAIVGGLICRIIQMPPLVGVLWMGIMWNNIPTLKYLTHGIVKEVFDICSKLGLTVILARAGYKLAIKEIIPHWKQTALLATLPFALEGVSHSLIANKIFKYENNYNWAFLQGMLCSIVSPAVVVPGSLYLQDLGYGRGVGPLSLMLSAVGIEIVIGVWCANFIIGLIFYDQKLAVAIVLGPVQFIGGIIIGIALGVLFYYIVELIKQEADRMPNGKYTRDHLKNCMDFAYMIFLFACYAMVFFGYKVSLAGGGCVMCVFFSATVAHMWTRTGKAEHEDHKKYVASWLAFTWDEAMMPILFATMGAKINVKAIFNATFFPKAIICMACSTAVRLIVTFIIQLGSGMPYKEKLLVCVGYLGKASAQASVGPIAANLVANRMAALPADQKNSLIKMAEYANNVQQISAMYVMFMACVASFGLVRGGQVVLKRDGSAKNKKHKKHKKHSKSTQRGDDASSSSAAAAAATAMAEVEPDDGTRANDAAVAAPRADGKTSRHAREGSFGCSAAGQGSSHHVSFATFEPLHYDDWLDSGSNRDHVH